MNSMRKGGWYKESYRHYLAAKGIKTSIMSRPGNTFMDSVVLGEKWDMINAAKAGGTTVPWAKQAGEASIWDADMDLKVMNSAKTSGERGTERVYHTSTHYLSDKCAMCGGPMMRMGKLGNKAYGRCRNCGSEAEVHEEQPDEFYAKKAVDSEFERKYKEMRKRYPCEFGKDDPTCGCGGCSAMSAWMDAERDAEELGKLQDFPKPYDAKKDYYARTIGRANVAEVKRLTNEAQADGLVSIHDIHDYVRDHLDESVWDTWEGSDQEIDRIVGDEVMKPTKYDAPKKKGFIPGGMDKLWEKERHEQEDAPFGYDAKKMEQWPKYKHVPQVKTPKQIYEFEEKTGRRHEGELWSHYMNREVTDDE